VKLITESLCSSFKVVSPVENTKDSRAKVANKQIKEILDQSDEQLVTVLCTEDTILQRAIRYKPVRFLLPSGFPMRGEDGLFKELFSGMNVLIDPTILYKNEIEWYYQTAQSFSSRVTIYCRYDPFRRTVPMSCMNKGLIIRASTKYYE